MSGNGKKKVGDAEVYFNERPGDQPYGHPMEHWKPDFRNAPSSNNIDKILDIPKIDDMAGIMARANFKNDRQRRAAVLLAALNKEFQDDTNQEILRIDCSSTLGCGAIGKIIQTFTATNVVAPDIWRASMGMPKHKSQNGDKEEVHRGSDLRSDGSESEMARRR